MSIRAVSGLSLLLLVSGACGLRTQAAAGIATDVAPPAPTNVYNDIVAAYMDGRWDALEMLLQGKTRDLVGLSTPEQADIATIRLALRESRQPWWKTTKAGAKAPIHPSIWGRTIPVLYDPGLRDGTKITEKNGSLTLIAGWPAADMDSTAPSDHGFTRGDAACLAAFANLGNVYAASALPAAEKNNVIPQERYLEFRAKLTGMAYGTPGARRYGIWICLSSYSDDGAKLPIRMARRAIASMFLSEVLTHRPAYPSLELPRTLAADTAEETLCRALADSVEKHAWTLTEDTAVRNAVKFLAGANGINAYNAGAITLPNKLTVMLDPKADAPRLSERNGWLKEQFDKSPAGN